MSGQRASPSAAKSTGSRAGGLRGPRAASFARRASSTSAVSVVPVFAAYALARRCRSSSREMIVRMMLSEEAGCLESQFQRVCRPRRDT